MKRISIQDLKAGLSAVLAEAEGGGTIVVTRHGEPIAQVGQVRPPGIHRASAAGRERLRPAVRRGSKGRYLTVLLEDRGAR